MIKIYWNPYYFCHCFLKEFFAGYAFNISSTELKWVTENFYLNFVIYKVMILKNSVVQS